MLGAYLREKQIRRENVSEETSIEKWLRLVDGNLVCLRQKEKDLKNIIASLEVIRKELAEQKLHSKRVAVEALLDQR